MSNLASSSPHITDADLVQFADGEMPVRAVNAAETHLRTCEKCRARLAQLKTGSAAYDRYHADVVKPSIELPHEWAGLQLRLENLGRPRNKFPFLGAMWWAVAAVACCGIAIVWFQYREGPTRRMQQVLARAVSVRASAHHRLQVSANGHVWFRAAKLEGDTPGALGKTRALFIKANYSWDDPLSVRSFAAWRKQLPNKRDQVLSIEDGDGERRFYRLQTETTAGVLRTAALTLRADTLNPVKGAFQFEHEKVTIDDAGEMPESPANPVTNKYAPVERTAVRQVGPAEELRVFAALSAINADVSEPVTVDIDASKQHVIVAGLGIPANRERQIRQALSDIPNTAIRFTSVRPLNVDGQSSKGQDDSPAAAAPLRHDLEAQAGGAQQFQLIADKALDASSAILAQAHALYVLSQKFSPSVASAFGPPERETLRSLRRLHAAAIQQKTLELKIALRPISGTTAAPADETENQQAASWEVGAAQLYQDAKLLDSSLGRILTGSYSQQAGQRIWSELPDEIKEVEALARSENNAR